MSKNKVRTLTVGIVIVILIALFMLPRWSDKTRAQVAVWDDAGVGCLPSHQNANLHIHPLLTITVDERSEGIPANVGIVRSCMAETHTHDAGGTVHIESVVAGKTFTLGQFFTIWGKSLEREGYDLMMAVDGVPSAEFGNAVMKDGQTMELAYVRQ